MPERLQLVRLRAAELDDQAIAEICALLGRCADLEARDLERLAQAQGLAVARRACGLRPEIVGVAVQDHGGVTCALDKRYVRPQDEAVLRARLAPAAWLFRPRDRAPLGWGTAAG